MDYDHPSQRPAATGNDESAIDQLKNAKLPSEAGGNPIPNDVGTVINKAGSANTDQMGGMGPKSAASGPARAPTLPGGGTGSSASGFPGGRDVKGSAPGPRPGMKR